MSARVPTTVLAMALAVPALVFAAEGGPPAVAGAGSVPAGDAAFVQQAAQGGLAEVELGKLAEQRSENEAVDQFAARMVKDHTAANAKLEQIATAQGLAPPKTLDPEHQRLKTRLQALHGDAFDAAYAEAMVEDHAKTIALFERQAGEGEVEALRTFATETLPVLEAHHELAQDLPGAE